MRPALITCAVLCASSVHASPVADLDNARQSFRAKDFQSAIRYVNPLLYPHEQLALPQDLVIAHELLGASKYETGQRDEAKSEFEKSLQLDPDTRLDPLIFSNGAIRLFDETRADVEAKQKRDTEIRKLQEERDRLQKFRESLVVYQKAYYYVNFVPFGAGQFQNHQTFKGALFAAGEGVTLAASAGAWLYLVNKYGLTSTHVQPADVNNVNLLTRIKVGAGIAFYGLYAWGVIDAILHFKSQTRVEGDDSLLPPDLRKASDKPKPKTSRFDHLHLAPMIAPTSVGIGLAWEN